MRSMGYHVVVPNFYVGLKRPNVIFTDKIIQLIIWLGKLLLSFILPDDCQAELKKNVTTRRKRYLKKHFFAEPMLQNKLARLSPTLPHKVRHRLA